MNTSLVLEDGTTMHGVSFGAEHGVAGEVVFNTGMAGYIETLTDPSYRGQIVVLTYPLIGSYGVPAEREDGSISAPFESAEIQVQGLVVQHYVDGYSHHSAQRSLDAWLQMSEVPAVTGIDTRTLTRHLREYGTMRGWLFPSDIPLTDAKAQSASIDMQNDVFQLVAPEQARQYGEGNQTVLLVDVGAKDNIVRSLVARGVKVLRVPWHDDLQQYADKIDGVVIGNGPGDPSDLVDLVEQIRWFLDHPRRIPIMGICLGIQLLAAVPA